MTTVYETLPNVSVKPLHIQESDLRDGRILSLMGGDDPVGFIAVALFFLYILSRDRNIHCTKILQSPFSGPSGSENSPMLVSSTRITFLNICPDALRPDFKDRLKAQTVFGPAERVAIQQRLGLLESLFSNQKEDLSSVLSNDRTVIVDLTDPLIDGERVVKRRDVILT